MPIKMPVPQPEALERLGRAVEGAGGRAWLVGGAVRDALLGLEARDVDVEVHGLGAAELEAALRTVGSVHPVGRSFGVFKTRIGQLTVDVSLPRADSRAGVDIGAVEGDPDLGIDAAARRRDLTINAIAADLLTGALADPCGGLADLDARRLRAADPARFGDDPLRALRVVRFSALLGFQPDATLEALCRQLRPHEEAPERVWGELERILLDAPRPGEAIALLARLDLLAGVFPGLDGHSAAVVAPLDALAARRGPLDRPGPRLAAALAVLLTPLGADEVVAILDRYRLVTRRGYPLRAGVLAAHAGWRALCGPTSDADLRRLAEGAEVAVVATVAACNDPAGAGAAALERAALLGVAWEPCPTLLSGRDLRRIGIPPGPQMGVALAQLREAQLRGEVDDPEEAIRWLERLWSDESG